jgi:hypothetical protein
MLRALAMTSHAATAKRGDGRLWVAALMLSLLCNAVALLLGGLAVIQAQQFQHPAARVAAPPVETVRIIAPELPAPVAPPTTAAAEPAAPAAAQDPGFARTSEDQRGKRPDKPAFIGERDTEATSDATPDPSAPAMPAQAGIQPRHPDDIETTESRYQDGALTAAAAALPPSPPQPPSPPAPAPQPSAVAPEAAARGETTATAGPDAQRSIPPPPEPLASGPRPVDVPVPLPTTEDNPQPGPPTLPREGTPDTLPTPDDLKETKATPAPQQTPQQTPQQPPFRGFQRKTTIQGSISRSGRSALDVEDSPLGRYQATISRAVELEWQRNCVRYRDFITPGFLTVRFFVDAKGKVRNVQFVGAMQTGQQQKGFTLNSIRDATIPAMPPDLRKDFQEDPLELVINFYF